MISLAGMRTVFMGTPTFAVPTLEGLLAAVTASRTPATLSPTNVDDAWQRLTAATSTSLESIA